MSVKIEITGDYVVRLPKGTIIEAEYVDSAGDAFIGDGGYDKYGTSWVFNGNFDVVEESETEPEEIEQAPVQVERIGYVLTATVDSVADVHTFLSALEGYGNGLDDIEITPVFNTVGGN